MQHGFAPGSPLSTIYCSFFLSLAHPGEWRTDHPEPPDIISHLWPNYGPSGIRRLKKVTRQKYLKLTIQPSDEEIKADGHRTGLHNQMTWHFRRPPGTNSALKYPTSGGQVVPPE
ncbi:hypothetical protein KQX54_020711 [Cotesia glomerata]|uniref:Uncharacterized protein n=1 Tax=Cotesia glomerata TaxID=32391 RepID=A0AAV7I1R5_COTGL|nr:hypothetical protein KQX54_020711 [Cotesia glomerata]